MAAVIAAALYAPIAVGRHSSGPTVQRPHNVIERPLLAEINDVRRAHGLDPLEFSSPLARAADAHAAAMGRRGFFSHDSADGSYFAKRIQRWYGSAGYWRWTVGENLLWFSSDTTPAEAVELWMASPPHRRVLLGDSWSEVGLAAVRVTNAPGVFGGDDVTIVAADFGDRS